MEGDRLADLVRAALTASDDRDAAPRDRAEMLMEMAMSLQHRPKSPEPLREAVELYDRALSVCPQDERLLRARTVARKGTALQAIPEEGVACLEGARAAFEEAIPVLIDFGRPEELAEAEMNLGVVAQNLAGVGRARITDATSAYQRALRTFDRDRFPQEFMILQNNLATAFLSMPFSDERGKLREASAVQAFEEGLKLVNLVDHPIEYARPEYNLGNALQYASSSHAARNKLRALDAHEEALKVRTRATTPLEYANTIANRANCLWNMPDDPARPEGGNRAKLISARDAYVESREIFLTHGEPDRARIVAEASDQIGREMLSSPAWKRAKVVVLSVTEGDDKPLKYPHIFKAARLMILNRIDLLPHVDFDVARAIEGSLLVNPDIATLQLSARTGEGLGEWYRWLDQQMISAREDVFV